jgi:hypothetical protein
MINSLNKKLEVQKGWKAKKFIGSKAEVHINYN